MRNFLFACFDVQVFRNSLFSRDFSWILGLGLRQSVCTCAWQAAESLVEPTKGLEIFTVSSALACGIPN